MGVITSIEVQKKHANRWSVFVDGRFVCGVDEETLYLSQLKVGDTVSEEALTDLIRTETYKKARESAFRLLSLRDRSSHEIRTRLTQKGFSEEITEQVLDWLVKNNFVDDKLFAEKWVASRIKDTAKPSGKRKILSELFAKGINSEIAKTALDRLDSDTECELAWLVIKKKLRINGDELPVDFTLEYAEKAKLYAYLAHRGFSSDVIRHVFLRLNETLEN